MLIYKIIEELNFLRNFKNNLDLKITELKNLLKENKININEYKLILQKFLMKVKRTKIKYMEKFNSFDFVESVLMYKLFIYNLEIKEILVNLNITNSTLKKILNNVIYKLERIFSSHHTKIMTSEEFYNLNFLENKKVIEKGKISLNKNFKNNNFNIQNKITTIKKDILYKISFKNNLLMINFIDVQK